MGTGASKLDRQTAGDVGTETGNTQLGGVTPGYNRLVLVLGLGRGKVKDSD